MTVFSQGNIKARWVELDRETGLPDGERVRLRIEVQPRSLAERRRLVAELFGCCADDPSFAQAVAEIEDERHAS